MIKVKLDLMMVKRGMTSKQLAATIGISPTNLSMLKTGKSKGIRFSTLNKICKALDCQPGDILGWSNEQALGVVIDEDAKRKTLMQLMSVAYNQVQDPKFNNFKVQLLNFSMALDGDTDYIKILIALRAALLQADLSLSMNTRISGLPVEYSNLYHFIAPQLKQIDVQVLDRYSHYGFVPLKNGYTIKYD